MKTLYTLLFILPVLSIQAQSSHFLESHKMNTSATASADFFQSNLMNKYDIKYLKLDIAVEPGYSFISGSCFYIVQTTQPLDTFAIEFKQTMALDSVWINNIKKPFSRSNDHIYIGLNPAIPPGTAVNIKFWYNGTPANGIFRDIDDVLTFTANVSESFQAREWFPAKQLLNDKIDSVDTWITTTKPNLAGSNGLLKAVIDLPGNKSQFQWSTHYPMSYYMPCFGVGNYIDYRNYAKPAAIAPDSILVQSYIVNNTGYFNAVKPLVDKTARYIEKMSELFGLYPFAKEKYGHIQANIGGGMEHQTMTTLSNFSELIVSHELGHQWFGDNVTCATWSDIWLNESFATYSHVLMQEKLPDIVPGTAAQEIAGEQENAMSAPGGSVYVPPSEAYNEGRIFDGRLSYDKGSAVIHNLRFEMQSDTLFFNTLKAYQNRFKGTFATTQDFKQVAEEVSGKDLTQFFNQWIYGEGFPTYNIVYAKLGNDTLILNVKQSTSMPLVTPVFKGLMEYRVKSAEGDTIIRVNHLTNNQTFKIRYTKTPTGVDVDPNNWIINRTGTNVQQANTWLGAISTAWENPANWSWNLVPDSNTDVIINTGTAVLNSTGFCKSINVSAGAQFTINPGYQLNITKGSNP